MKKKLIILNGSPYVGKSACTEQLFTLIEGCAWLDGDDVWRVNPFSVDDPKFIYSFENVQAVLTNYFHFGFNNVILTWVLPSHQAIKRITSNIDDVDFETHVFTLFCDEVPLLSRARQRDNELSPDLIWLHKCQKLDTTKIETSHKTPETLAHDIFKLVFSLPPKPICW